MKIITTKKEYKKRIRKQILTVVTIIFVILTTIKVKAGSQDSTLNRHDLISYYSSVVLNNERHLYNAELYEINDKYIYCIELGKPISSTIYDSTNNLLESGYNEEQINYIKKLIYYGYKYKDTNNLSYYLATQELIWEYLNNVEVVWVNRLFPDGPSADIEIFKKNIINDVNNSDKKLSIDGKRIEVLAGDNLKINNIEESLENYDIITDLNKDVVNNEIIIKTNKNDFNEHSINLKRKNYISYDSVLYTNTTSQKMLSPGKIDMPDNKVIIDIKPASLTVNLVDEETKNSKHQGDATLTGAEYIIYDENKNIANRFTTQESVPNKIEGLSKGKYYIKQIKESNGYEINDKEVEIDINKINNEITLEQKVIKKKVEIFKIYGDKIKNTFNPESNIEFTLYNSDNNIYNKIITDNKGFTEIELPYGKYMVEQKNTTDGYSKINNFEIDINKEIEEKIRYNLYDDVIRVKLNILTLNKETNKIIQQKSISYKLKNIDKDEYIRYKGIDVFETNEKGELIIPKSIEYGNYELEQVNAPKNFMSKENKIKISIDSTSNIYYKDNNIFMDVIFYNNPIKCIINIKTNKEIFETEINKYDYKIIPRENIELKIIANEDIVSNDKELIYKKGDIIDNIKTNKNGEIKTKLLYLGNYCIEEKETNIYKCINIKNESNNKEIIERSVELLEEIYKSNIDIKNIEEESNTPIKDSKFEIYNSDNKVINTSMTNEDGIIKIKNIPNGEYKIKQIEVSEKYELNNYEYKLIINNKDEEVIITNEKKNKYISIPNTLNINNSKKLNISLIIILGGILYAFGYKKNRNNNCDFRSNLSNKNK